MVMPSRCFATTAIILAAATVTAAEAEEPAGGAVTCDKSRLSSRSGVSADPLTRGRRRAPPGRTSSPPVDQSSELDDGRNVGLTERAEGRCPDAGETGGTEGVGDGGWGVLHE